MKNRRRFLTLLLTVILLLCTVCACATTTPPEENLTAGTAGETVTTAEEKLPLVNPSPIEGESGNIFVFNDGDTQITLELCSSRMVRLQYSLDGDDGYRPADPEYYMVQLDACGAVGHLSSETDTTATITTDEMEIRINKSPFTVAMYDRNGSLLTKDAGTVYQNGSRVGIRKSESRKNAGGIFGFGSGDHGRRADLNRYGNDFSEFSMSHGRVIAPFFMSTVGYGIFLNTISPNTTFFKQGGGFETEGYLDYFFMYGPDFKTILNEYAELTGRMELFGKWALGFMLSKYGNDNATQKEFLEWLHKLRDEGYPCDCYVFDYGWRGDIADTQSQHGAGQKWGKQMWSNDTKKFPDVAEMFREARELGFHVGLHNNAGTPEASGGKELYKEKYAAKWVKSYMDAVIMTGHGDFFWPDEFDVLGSNTAPVFAAKGAYEAWQEYTDASRPMFMTRGNYAGQHFATAWSGDISPNTTDLAYQIGFALDTGLVGFWATSCDLGGFISRPSNELYTRWVAEFGAWSAMMRTHGHDGREPWTYDATAQETLKANLRVRYSLYPYLYSSEWQGYSQGTPIMRAMILEDDSQYNPDAWNLNKQYYFGDWFLVAPATETTATYVSVWFPANTTWYSYTTGERYEGGSAGATYKVWAELDEIPVFVKSGAIIPMGPDVDYADEYPLDPLTLDIYPSAKKTTYTLYEDDGESRKYLTENAYSTTDFSCVAEGNTVTVGVGARVDHNPDVYKPCDRSYHLQLHLIKGVNGVTVNGTALKAVKSLDALAKAESGYYLEGDILHVRFKDTGKAVTVTVNTTGIVVPAAAKKTEEQKEDEPDISKLPVVTDGTLYELEKATLVPNGGENLYVNGEWKGYTGTGFVKPFKTNGDKITFDVNVVSAAPYDLTIRVNCGKKGSANFDATDRTGGLYIDGKKIASLSFAVTETWGDEEKNGDWRTYTFAAGDLTAGKHTIAIVAEGQNAGNFNLDSMKFTVHGKAVNGFEKIEAESATVLRDAAVSGGVVNITKSGASIGFASVLADGKKGFTACVKSATGGTLTVFETGVGDKILATVELPDDGEWHELSVTSKDTDADPSPIYLEFTSLDTIDVSVDWFKFTK